MSSNAMDIYTINVAGKKFCIQRSLMLRFPVTRLAKLTRSSEEYNSEKNEFYFDRNPKIMQNILDLYRTGELHIPHNMCSVAVRKELDFWGIPQIWIAECCWKAYSVHERDEKAQNIIKETFHEYIDKKFPEKSSLREAIWWTMEHPSYSVFARIWNVLYLAFITLAIIIFCLFNEPTFRIKILRNVTANSEGFYADENSTMGMFMHSLPNPYLYFIDNIGLVFFTIEIIVRFTVCPSKKRFAKHPLNILDMCLIVIMWMVFIMDRFPQISQDSSDVKRIETFLRLCFSLRIFRILHFAKRSKTMRILVLTFKSSATELTFLMIGLGMAVLIFATLVFTTEMVLSTHAFDNIHSALWWALITMTTVGYGDYVPKSVPGQIVGSLCAIVGLLILSLPIAIIASNFNTYIAILGAREHRSRAMAEPIKSKVREIKVAPSIQVFNGVDHEEQKHPIRETF